MRPICHTESDEAGRGVANMQRFGGGRAMELAKNADYKQKVLAQDAAA
jgi:hypothetical protein